MVWHIFKRTFSIMNLFFFLLIKNLFFNSGAHRGLPPLRLWPTNICIYICFPLLACMTWDSRHFLWEFTCLTSISSLFLYMIHSWREQNCMLGGGQLLQVYREGWLPIQPKWTKAFCVRNRDRISGSNRRDKICQAHWAKLAAYADK